MKEEVFDIKTPDGFILKAIACIPEQPSKIVIMCHGISSHKQEYLDMFPVLAGHLYECGVGSVRFDYRGHGESSGASIDFDVISQLIDIDSVVLWIKSNDQTKLCKLSYVGVSFGGAPGIIYQDMYKAFDRISLFAPVISYMDTFVTPSTEWGKENFSLKAWDKARIDGFLLLDGEFKVSIALLNEFLILDPLSIMKELKLPIQIYHGTNDTLVPCSVVEKLSSTNPELDIHIIPGMGHGLYYEDDEDGISPDSKLIQQAYYKDTVRFICEL